MYYLQKNSIRLNRWLTKLKEKRSRSSALSNLYRSEGNEFFMSCGSDLAADYYTKAIFAATKDSIELALAHANRAACFLHMQQFMEVYHFHFKITYNTI